jgi:hypothetical protein
MKPYQVLKALSLGSLYSFMGELGGKRSESVCRIMSASNTSHNCRKTDLLIVAIVGSSSIKCWISLMYLACTLSRGSK